MRKRMITLILSVALACAFVMPVSAASRATLEARIENASGDRIIKSICADMDGDGQKEVFAVAGDWEYGDIWFASSRQTRRIERINLEYGSCSVQKVSKKQKVFIAEISAGGSGSHSVCCYVKAGKVHKVSHSHLEGLTHAKGRKFYIYPSAFDSSKSDGIFTGHTYKRYYLKWTGTKFVEYKGKYISQKTLKKYKGAAAVLKKIRNAGYKVNKIIRRTNGVININVSRKSDWGGTDYNNVTLKIRGRRVQVISSKWGAYGTNIVERSGYGGIYKKSGY